MPEGFRATFSSPAISGKYLVTGEGLHQVRDGRIKRGDLIVLEAMGGGFTWGAAVVRI